MREGGNLLSGFAQGIEKSLGFFVHPDPGRDLSEGQINAV